MTQIVFTLPSFAKINLFLRILGKRTDGFHEICTIFQMVSLHDNLTFSKHDEIVLTCQDKKIPTDERNLIVRAALELKQKCNIKTGAKIHLEKNIPSPGGLGGGSSNAAVALFGLIKLWEIEIGSAELLKIGEKLGSDVPFFFNGGTALGSGRGTDIFSLDEFVEEHILIVTPKTEISTAEAFANLNAPRLTNKTPKSILQICRDEAKSLDLRLSLLTNDFEKTIFNFEPEIELIKKKLLELKAKCALLSGSGASVFAIFESRSQLQSAFDELKTEQTWRKFIVRTISRQEHRALLNFEQRVAG